MQSLTEIMTAAVEATLRPERWHEVCDALERALDTRLVLLFEFNSAANAAPLLYGGRSLPPDGQRILDTFQNGGDDPRPYRELARRPLGEFVPETELYGVADHASLPEHGFRDASFAILRASARGGVRLNDIGPYLDAIGIHVSSAREDFRPAFRDTIARIAPVIGKAVETGRILRSLTRTYGALLQVFDMLDFGAAICAPDGRLMLDNSSFRDIARDGDALTMAQGQVGASDADDRFRLRSLIRAASHPGTPPAALVTALRRRSGRPPLVIKAAPIREREIGPADYVLLLALDPADGRTLDAAGIGAFGLLTPAELAVCELLVRGHPAHDIATARDTSVETARSQVKSISRKLACPTRLDIVRLAMATSAPVRKKPGDPPAG